MPPYLYLDTWAVKWNHSTGLRAFPGRCSASRLLHHARCRTTSYVAAACHSPSPRGVTFGWAQQWQRGLRCWYCHATAHSFALLPLGGHDAGSEACGADAIMPQAIASRPRPWLAVAGSPFAAVRQACSGSCAAAVPRAAAVVGPARSDAWGMLRKLCCSCTVRNLVEWFRAATGGCCYRHSGHA